MTFENDMAQAQRTLEGGQFKHAFRAAKSAARKKPRSPFAPNIAGIALAQTGKHRDAVGWFKKAMKLDPGFSDARRNLAQSYLALGDSDTAQTLLNNLVKQTPGDADAWYLLAQVELQSGAPLQAEHAAGKSIELAPKQVPKRVRAYNIRALARNQMGQIDTALEDFEAALRLDPANVETLVNISLPLARQTRYREAMDAVTRAVELAPGHLGARLRLANQLMESGDNDAAIAQLHKALDLAPKHAEVIETLSKLQSGGQNERLETTARDALKSAPKKSPERASLQFALATIATQDGRTSEADRFLTGANKDMAALLPYDVDHDSVVTDGLLARFQSTIGPGQARPPGPFPIYVVGLPRSGTTLAEAILGAHPGVAPLGERIAAGVLLHPLIEDDLPFDKAAIEAFVAGDQRLLPALPPGTQAYVDKMPENHRYLGFLATAQPHARFINLKRDPRDIALSMWVGHFSGAALAYAYDLKAMAHRFNLCAKTMAHWRTVMPDAILDVPYEHMVEDVDATSRLIADFCGLDWTPGMARPDLNADQILTSSATQLRQPVHNRSVGKWRQHEDMLAPFIEALDPNYWPEVS